jgi:NADPH-dependent 7-cyano-7-deazaguanine reductase QueF-like protein
VRKQLLKQELFVAPYGLNMLPNQPEQSQLGKASAYLDQYDASLLYPLVRQTKRDELGIAGTLPFMGADLWTAYELSWLNARQATGSHSPHHRAV